jgi:hypothetical protein
MRTNVLLAGESGIPSAGVTIFGTLGALVLAAAGEVLEAVSRAEVVVDGVVAVINNVGNHALSEEELVGRTFALVALLKSLWTVVVGMEPVDPVATVRVLLVVGAAVSDV